MLCKLYMSTVRGTPQSFLTLQGTYSYHGVSNS